MKPLRYLSGLLAQARQARAQSGKPFRAQLAEIVALRRMRLGISEYYEFRLFDDARISLSEKRGYTGWRFERDVYPAINDPGLLARSGLTGGWNGAIDKVLFDCLARGAGIPTPVLLAVYDPDGIAIAGVETCRTRAELEHFFRSSAHGCFVKPARAHHGAGALGVERIDGAHAVLANGQSLLLDGLLDAILARGRTLVQERVRPHPVLAAAMGSTLPTVRAVVLRRPARSTVHRTAIRIPRGANMVDNFAAGRTGNLVGWVEPTLGTITRVFAGVGLTQTEVSRHPDTEAVLPGLALPDWPAALEVIDRASRVFAAMPLQAWDLALADRGPVIIELNDVSAQRLLQLAGPPGMLDRELSAFLREQGVRWPEPR